MHGMCNPKHLAQAKLLHEKVERCVAGQKLSDVVIFPNFKTVGSEGPMGLTSRGRQCMCSRSGGIHSDFSQIRGKNNSRPIRVSCLTPISSNSSAMSHLVRGRLFIGGFSLDGADESALEQVPMASVLSNLRPRDVLSRVLLDIPMLCFPPTFDGPPSSHLPLGSIGR